MEFAQARPYYDKFQTWAVLGVTTDPEKFSYQVFEMLHRTGKTVYGISPKYPELLGYPLYKSLRDLPEKPEVVVFMVNPKIGIRELDTVKELGIANIWLQPGSFDDAFLQHAGELGLFIIDKCVLIVQARY